MVLHKGIRERVAACERGCKNSEMPCFQIAQLKRDIRVNTNVEILSQNAKEQLWELANSSVADKDTWNYYTDIVSLGASPYFNDPTFCLRLDSLLLEWVFIPWP